MPPKLELKAFSKVSVSYFEFDDPIVSQSASISNIRPYDVAQHRRRLSLEEIPYFPSLRLSITHHPVPDGPWGDAQVVDDREFLCYSNRSLTLRGKCKHLRVENLHKFRRNAIMLHPPASWQTSTGSQLWPLPLTRYDSEVRQSTSVRRERVAKVIMSSV